MGERNRETKHYKNNISIKNNNNSNNNNQTNKHIQQTIPE